MNLFPSATIDSSGHQCGTSGNIDPPCEPSCSGARHSPAAGEPTEGSSEERSPADPPAETSGDCRRQEPPGEDGPDVVSVVDENRSQPARRNQDSDDSDDDPILIPSARFRGQGQRYVRQLDSQNLNICFVTFVKFHHCLSYCTFRINSRGSAVGDRMIR